MDEQQAWELFNAGQPVSVNVGGHRLDGALIIGLHISTGANPTMDLLLRTRVGEPDRRIRVGIDRVDLVS